MKQPKSLKQRLIAAVLVLVMVFTSLIGTTFAWFTDRAASEGNVIQTGTLKVDLLHKTGDNWISVKDNPDHKVFDYDKWEPGYTRVETLKVANLGSLALKYKLSVEALDGTAVTGANGENLADVIEVYITYSETTESNYSDITSSDKWVRKGTLTEVLNAPASFITGNLFPSGQYVDGSYGAVTGVGNQIVKIALHMKEDAGNEYQKLSIGDVSVNIVATQWTYENDSFGSDYDKDSVFPELNIGGITVDVQTANGVVTDTATISGEGVSGIIPAGVAVDSGVNKLGLSVTEKAESDANLTLNDGEALRSLDVHMYGVSKNNTVPMLITVEQAMKPGLNIGNYTLYHLENGVTVAMTAVNTAADLDAHNEFYYDPATGDVTLAMATFSEVAIIAEPAKWEGKRDYSWYDASKTELTIANADQLAAFGAIVGGMAKTADKVDIDQDSFAGKTVKLVANINLGDAEAENNPKLIFYPIGYYNSEGTYERTNTAITSGLRTFEGTFDGNGNTVSNFYHNTWEMKGDHNWYSPEEQYYRDGMGLFGRVYKGTVKNLTVKNFSSDGEIATTGVIAAYADGATFENIAIFDCNPRVYNIGNGGIVGCVGWYANEAGLTTKFKNITVDNSNKISALWGSYDVACGGIVGQYYPTSGQTSANSPKNAGIDFNNCHISAQLDVYNDVCGNYQYYAYRYAGMLIGSVRENVTIDGHVYPDMDGIEATNCTVHFGTWNDYYYCEFEKNGHPSYSGPDDYKFSRIPHSEINFTDSNKNGIIDTEGERASVTGCKHEHTAAENNQAIYLPFNNLVTGYGWGVTTKVVGQLEGVTILDREVANSVIKFESKVTELTTNRDYTIGEIFSYINDCGVDVVDGAINVTIRNLDENGNVIATFERGKKWNEGTISFENTGNIEIVIQDYYFCTPTTITVAVKERQPEEKFDVVMNNGDFLHRVGNVGTVALDKLFKAKDGVSVGTVSVTVEAVTTGTSASGTYSNNAIQFSGTGVVKVTITDNEYCIPAELYLEVVDAVNATGVKNATSNNVVLLNDCGFSSLEVSGGYALYGNGFTMTCATDSASLGFEQFVKLNNGTLDNVQIVCPNYDYAALYSGQLKDDSNRSETDAGGTTRYYNAKSAVLATGNSEILNSRISGGLAALNAAGGNIVVDNSRLELGAVATVLISAANSVTFRDIVLVQKPTVSTYKGADGNSPKTLMGMSVLFKCEADGTATPLTLEGTLVQYAWADASYTVYMPEGTDSIANTVLGKTNFIHSINGKNSVNLGFAYTSESGSVAKPSNITDNRTNKAEVPYEYESVKASVPLPIGGSKVIDTYVYTYKNTSGTHNDYKNETEYIPNRYSDIVTVSYTDTAEGLSHSKTYGTDGWIFVMNVDLDTASSYKLDFSKLSMIVNGISISDFKVNDGTKPTEKISVFAGSETYTLTANIGEKSYTATFVVIGVETSKDAPSLVDKIGGNKITSGDVSWGQNKCVTRKDDDGSTTYTVTAPVLEGLIVRYWSVSEGKYVDLDLTRLTPANSTALNGTNNYWEYTDPDDDFTLKLTNTEYVHSNNKRYAMPVAYDGKLYFVSNNKDGLVSTSSGARTLKMKYEFTDDNGGTLTFEHTWSQAYDSKNPLKYQDMTGIKDGCVTPDTLITLADGTQVRVDSLKGDELLLVWNMETGKLDYAPIMFIDSDPEEEVEVIKLYFSDGTEVKVIYEHGFWDYDLNKYVYLDASAADYIGHTFAKQDGDTLEKVQLVDVVIETELTTAWSPVTVGHLCYFVNGMLSMPGGVGGLFNIFEVDAETMTYDYEQIAKDIETYGLFTYEELNAICPLTEEMFNAAGGAYLKISIGKGNLTMEELIYMINRYSKYI